MFTKKIFSIFVITLFAIISATSEINGQDKAKPIPEGSSSFESVNKASLHMSYDNTTGIIEQQSSDDAKRRSSFTVKKGKYGYIFEALYQPGSYFYVEDSNKVIPKQLPNPTDEDMKRISFTSLEGRSRQGSDYYTFKSVKFPNLYLRHCGLKLVVHDAEPGNNTMGCSINNQIRIDDITWKLAEPFTTVSNPKADNKHYSFRSVNYKDMYIHHNNGLLDITKILSPTRENATFKMVDGLSGDSNTVSFESIDKPGQFLRHQSYRVKLQPLPKDFDELYNKDATFKIVNGNVGKDANLSEFSKSFESVNIPGFYLRHCGFQLWLDNNKMKNKFCNPTDKVYREDTSFIVIDGLAK